MQITPAQRQYAGKQYTIDTFPENPERETHELARLALGQDDFVLHGDIYGAHYQEMKGRYSFEGGKLVLQESEGAQRRVCLQVDDHDPEYFWPGRDIAIEGLPQWQGKQVTVHRVPDDARFTGPLSHREEKTQGHHRFVSERHGQFEMDLNADRTAHLQGVLDGRPVDWAGRWLNAYPMSYFKIDGGQDFISWHNNHDCGGHGQHGHHEPPVTEIKDMPVDVIVTTSGKDESLRRVYAMTMNPSKS